MNANAKERPIPGLILQNRSTCLILSWSDSGLPQVLHWGAPLGNIGLNDLQAMAAAARLPGIHNGMPDEGYRLSLHPEEWRGWPGHPGLSGSAAGRRWAPKFRTTSVSADGKPLTEWALLSSCRLSIDAIDEVAGLRLLIELELHESGVVRQRQTITNIGSDPYQVEQLLCALPVPTRATEILDFAGRWGKERTPQRTTLGVGCHWRENRHGRAGHDSAYILHLGVEGFGFGAGEVWSVHTAWSGNHLHFAERVLTNERVIGGGELLLPGEIVLQTGDNYRSPWVIFAHGDGLDAIAARHHAFLRSTHPVGPSRPVTLNVWEAVYFDHDVDRLLDLADRAEKLGVERFVLDDGWFGARRNDHAGLGDWYVSPAVWPDGLHPLVDSVTSMGMQFGLWFEPEMVSPDSDLAREHPDWILQVPGRLPLESRHQWVLDIANPQAYTHVRDQLLAMLDEYEISYIKWDHNRDLLDAGSSTHRRPGVHDQTLAFYRLIDEVKAAHPGLEIESCSSGGARIDLEVLQRCDRVWTSDNIDPTDRQQMNRWTAQLIPPEFMGSHIASGASHTTGRHHDIAYRAATAVFGHLGIEWDLARATQEELGALKQWITWFKEERELLLAGRLVRVDTPDPNVYLHGIVGEERAIYSYTRLDYSGTWSDGMMQLPGLEPTTRYRVHELALTVPEGATPLVTELTGQQLAVVGMQCPQVKPEHSRIIIAEAVAPIRGVERL